MFDAATAALFAAAGDQIKEPPKTHAGVIAAFGLHLVKGGHLDAELGRSIHRVQHLRQVADYLGDPVPGADAASAVAQAGMFVDAIEARFGGASAVP